MCEIKLYTLTSCVQAGKWISKTGEGGIAVAKGWGWAQRESGYRVPNGWELQSGMSNSKIIPSKEGGLLWYLRAMAAHDKVLHILHKARKEGWCGGPCLSSNHFR